MGGIINFLLSVNRISLIAFIGVLGFLIYELYLLRKEQLKKQKPILPHFDQASIINKPPIPAQVVPVTPQKIPINHEKKPSTVPFLTISLIIITFLIFIVSLYLFVLGKKQKQTQVSEPKIIIQEISSPGLKIYTRDWVEVNEKKITPKFLKGGTELFIGIQTIDEADIDRARIRVNEGSWNVSHITSLFNKEKKMYYKAYTVATGESKLKIDAQLHSTTDGWLGD